MGDDMHKIQPDGDFTVDEKKDGKTTMIKLAFVWDWEVPAIQCLTWKDGLAKAIQILSKEWEVKCYSIGKDTIFYHDYFPIILKPIPELLAQEILKEKPDAILVFGDFTRPTIPLLANRGIPMACCLAGGTFRNYVDCFDLIFVESEVYKNQLEAEGKRVIKAFGTNTELFKPIKQPKIWDAINSSTFALWKRHELFAKAMEGYKTFCFGWMYHNHETECWKIPQEKGVMIAPHIPMEVIPYLLNASYTSLITSDSTGGSQRSVLEAISCGIPPIVMTDSDKTTEYIRESGFGKTVNPTIVEIREAVDFFKKNPPNPEVGHKFIIENYSEYIYAKKLQNGILSIL